MEEYINDEPNGLETLQAMYERWPFWNTAIANAEMILSKADLTIARLYADLVVDQRLASRVFGRIEQEYNRSVKMVCRVAKQGALLERMPVLQRSIQQRNPYVDPLSFIQTVLLRRLRSGDSGEELQAGVLEKYQRRRGGPEEHRVNRLLCHSGETPHQIDHLDGCKPPPQTPYCRSWTRRD
jgi:phosphoenolpyruvate carboxylase